MDKRSVDSLVFFQVASSSASRDLSELVDVAQDVLKSEVGVSDLYFGNASSYLSHLKKVVSKETYYAYARRDGGIFNGVMSYGNLGVVDSGDMLIFYGTHETPEQFFKTVVDFKNLYNEVFEDLGSKIEIVYKRNPNKAVDLSHVRMKDVVSTKSEKQKCYAA